MKNKKHIVMIIANSSDTSYFRWFAELNHKENAFKLSFVFLHTEMPQIAADVKKYGVDSYWIYFDTYRRKPLQYIRSCSKFYFLFCRILPDVVHTNLFDDSLPALLAARLAMVKKRVITKQDTGFHVNFAPSMVKFDKFNNANATHLIACSEESREFILKNENGDAAKITLIHHGVDESFITRSNERDIFSIKEKYHLHGKFVIGTVARYIGLKGYFTMIDAAEKLVKLNSDIVFIGLGYGAQKTEFEEKIRKKGLENNFILTDKVEYSLIPSFYACMDIYLHAALIEPFGFVIAEAMFNRKPIITTRVGASRDVLEHLKSAYLIDFENVDQIVEGVNYFLNNDTARIVEEAYNLAKNNFSREKMWSSYRDLFLS